MTHSEPAAYVLAPGVDVVHLPDDSLLFRSDTLSVRLEGPSGELFGDRILPLLDGRRSAREIAEDVGVDPADLGQHLEELVRAGVLRRRVPGQDPFVASPGLKPLLAMAEATGWAPDQARERLEAARIAIFGLEGAGGQAAALLGRAGVGHLSLLDPFPLAAGDLATLPQVPPSAVGQRRDETLSQILEASSPGEVRHFPGQELDAEDVADAAEDCDLMIGAFDVGFSACHHWINRAALSRGIPALFARHGSYTAEIGPLVLPGQTPCYMCFRMREIACEENFEEAMQHEEHQDRQRRPHLAERPGLPMLAAWAGSLLAQEALSFLLALTVPNLAGKILRFDAFSFETTSHSLLQKPDCPVCKKKLRRSPAAAEELISDESEGGDLRAVAKQLVDSRVGVVQALRLFQKDPSEPEKPYVFQARLANHRFTEDPADDYRGCSGKGMSVEDGRVSALGEAVERYSGGCWESDELTFGPATALPGNALDPRELVLFRPEQYADLPYADYDGTNPMAWMEARSLIDGRLRHVPALAVLMSYEIHYPREFLFPATSNGLAAGATLPGAVLAALVEVLERDAFLITWLNRLPARRLDAAELPDPEIIQLVGSYQRRGVTLELYRLPTDHPCSVFMGLGVSQGGVAGAEPAVVVGLGADLDPVRAGRSALLEIAQVRPALRRRLRRPETRERLDELLVDPGEVATLEDHDLLYASPDHLGAFDFLRESSVESTEWTALEPKTPAAKLECLLSYFADNHQDVLYVDLTPPDMARLGLHTARVIVPGFQPMHFGRSERRLGGTRLYELPRKLGLAPAPTTPESLNDLPHPLA